MEITHKTKQNKWAPINAVGVVIVAFGNEDTLEKLLDKLVLQKQDQDYIVVVDNHPRHMSAAIAKKHNVVDRVVSSSNIGFAAGCNLGVEKMPAQVDALFFLNPDTTPSDDAINLLRKTIPSNWAACMPLLTLPKQRVNSAGNVLHISGLSWCDGFNEPINAHSTSCEVSILSGACTFIRTDAWNAVGGFAEDYFMYYEDTDLSLRLRSLGYKIGLIPAAQIEHDYEFNKSNLKWFYIERNRYILIVRLFPFSVILSLAPLLLFMEVGLFFVSIFQGRGILRLRSQIEALKLIPDLLRQRHIMERESSLSSVDFFRLLNPSINTPLLGNAKMFSVIFRTYYVIVQYVLCFFSVNNSRSK